MSIYINKDTKVITQGITGKTGQFHTRMCRDYANGKDCFVAGVNPKKAGEDFEGIPIYGTVREAKQATGATAEKVTEAFKIMLANPKVKAILVNIFGGIMRCDTIAEGIIAAVKQVGLKVPLVVRLEGTNVELGKKMLAESGLAVTTANDMADGARRVVALAAGKAA